VCEHVSMVASARTKFAIACCATIAFCSIAFVSSSVHAGGCNFEAQGEGRVAAVIDARSFRLDDGREIRLTGIEVPDKTKAVAALSALLIGRDVTLRSGDETPDRYGRQPAFVFLAGFRDPGPERAFGPRRGAGGG
jgi:endonuclease YncB( thermonuclease family)